MKLARYKLGDNAPAYGLIRGENIYEVKGDIFSEYAPTGNQYPLSSGKTARAGDAVDHRGGGQELLRSRAGV